MDRVEQRLRGWKSIARHLGVTQSTAIRWSKQSSFPVTRATDGGAVYASAADLDSWLRTNRVGSQEGVEESADVIIGDGATLALLEPIAFPSHAGVRRRRVRAAGVASLVAFAAIAGSLAVGSAMRSPSATRAATSVPPALMSRYVDARANWAERSPSSLRRAIAEFQRIVADHPDFQPGFTGLADAYILSCEFSTTDRATAFRLAGAAASTGLALAPDDADANRITGFLTYWTTRDIARARPYFTKAKQAPESTSQPLLHLWYGNALIDAGEIANGIDELASATRAAPDSAAVLTDYAIGQWQAGNTAAAMRALDVVERRFDRHAAAFGAKALFALSSGDVAAYLDQSTRWAALVGDQRQIARVQREQGAGKAGGGTAVLRLIADQEPLVSSFWHGGNLPAAIAASLLGDRARMLAVMRRPGIERENWRPLRFPVEPLRRWHDDPVLSPLLDRVFGNADYTRYPSA